MLDIDLKWMVVLLLNFLALIFILNILLFRPLLKIFKERETTVKGSLDAAKDMDRKKEEGIEMMTRELTAARLRAKEAFEKLREDGLNSQKSMLADAEAQASAMLQRAREELRSESDKARTALKAETDKFAEDIVRKLVKA